MNDAELLQELIVEALDTLKLLCLKPTTQAAVTLSVKRGAKTCVAVLSLRHADGEVLKVSASEALEQFTASGRHWKHTWQDSKGFAHVDYAGCRQHWTFNVNGGMGYAGERDGNFFLSFDEPAAETPGE